MIIQEFDQQSPEYNVVWLQKPVLTYIHIDYPHSLNNPFHLLTINNCTMRINSRLHQMVSAAVLKLINNS